MDRTGKIQLVDQTGKINVLITSLDVNVKTKSHELNDYLNQIAVIESFYILKEIEIRAKSINELNFYLIFQKESVKFPNENVSKMNFSSKNILNLMFTVTKKSAIFSHTKNVEIQVLLQNSNCLCNKRSELKNCRIIMESRSVFPFLDVNQIYELSIERDDISIACDVHGLQYRHILFIKSKHKMNIECIGEEENTIQTIQHLQLEHSKNCEW